MEQTNKIRFAFAVNNKNQFEKKHFGDAAKYIIKEWVNNEFIDIAEEINIFKNLDESQAHGSKKKGEAIINFLQQKNVKALVSMQFGKNIKLVNKYFVPITVKSEELNDALNLLVKHMIWIEDELKQKSSDFKLFSINNGVLKSNINNK